jgi:hypothetical protein
MKSNKIKIYGSKIINAGTQNEEQVKGELIREVVLATPITSSQAIDLEGDKDFCSKHGFKHNHIFINLV